MSPILCDEFVTLLIKEGLLSGEQKDRAMELGDEFESDKLISWFSTDDVYNRVHEMLEWVVEDPVEKSVLKGMTEEDRKRVLRIVKTSNEYVSWENIDDAIRAFVKENLEARNGNRTEA